MAGSSGRYARAFAEVIIEHKMDSGVAVQELEAMADLIQTSAELRQVLENPSVPHGQKIHLLDSIVARTRPSKLLRNFMAVLIDHRQIRRISELAEEFRHELNRRMGVAEAAVLSAREMDAREKKALESRIAALTGMTVRASYEHDPALLGGAIVRVGSTLYDGSVRGHLERLKRQIAGA